MLPDFLLGAVDRYEIQGTGAAGVTTAEIGRDEAFDACLGRSVRKTHLEIAVRAWERDYESILAAEHVNEFFKGWIV